MACWFGFLVLTTFLVLYPGLVIALRKPEWYPYAHRMRRAGARWCLFWGAVKVECLFDEPLDNRTYVITPNHTSKLDMIVLTAKLGVDFNFAGKSAFGNIPLFGMFFRTIDIPIDVKNPSRAAAAYKRAANQLGEGKNLAIFPEGTIARITPQLSPFKEGAFRLAIEKQVDILPVTMIGNWDLLPDDGPFHFKPGKIIMNVHKPISTKGMDIRQSKELSKEVLGMMENKLGQFGH